MKAYEGSSSEWEKFSDDEFQPEEVKVDLNSLLNGTDQAFKNKIYSLKTIFSYALEEDNPCCICLEKFKKFYTELLVLGCGHPLHMKCCIDVLKCDTTKMICPLCRKEAITGKEIE